MIIIITIITIYCEYSLCFKYLTNIYEADEAQRKAVAQKIYSSNLLQLVMAEPGLKSRSNSKSYLLDHNTTILPAVIMQRQNFRA